MSKEDTRYPYTYGEDLIRFIVGYNSEGTKINRVEAGDIVELFSIVLGMEASDIASKLADYYLNNEDSITKKAAEDFLKCIRD